MTPNDRGLRHGDQSATQRKATLTQRNAEGLRTHTCVALRCFSKRVAALGGLSGEQFGFPVTRTVHRRELLRELLRDFCFWRDADSRVAGSPPRLGDSRRGRSGYFSHLERARSGPHWYFPLRGPGV